MFLYIDPLKQGLKRIDDFCKGMTIEKVFIHRSIKTRIETVSRGNNTFLILPFLYIDPLKQGLKLLCFIGEYEIYV